MDKKKFGSYIKDCRAKKNYTQQELANLLYVDVTTISKWERGVTYPDITLIPDICKTLDITEHELIEASHDTEYRKMKKDAKKYNNMKLTTFWTINICYITAFVVTFIVNLAVNHTLSWFFIVLSSLVCGYTFCPTITYLFSNHKKLIFFCSIFISLFLLFLTCSIYSSNYWFMIPTMGILLLYFIIFYPILFKRSKNYISESFYNKINRFFLLSYIIGILIILSFLYLCIYLYSPFNIALALLITYSIFSVHLIFGIMSIFKINKIVYKLMGVLIIVLLFGTSIFGICRGFYLKSTKYNGTLSITEVYSNIKIECTSSDIAIYPSNSKTSSLSFVGNKYVSYSYEVINNELIVFQKDNRKFFDKFTNFVNFKVVLYLSDTDLENLSINITSGDVLVSKDFTFNTSTIITTTGDIRFESNVKDVLLVNATSGDISLKNISCKNLNVKCTTGDIELLNSHILEDTYLKATTGDIEIENLITNNLDINVSTGDIELENSHITKHLNVLGKTSDFDFEELSSGTINIKLTTGDICGTLSNEMIIQVSSTTGKVKVPDSKSGGLCNIKVTTGDVIISYR